jgi:putative transposase
MIAAEKPNKQWPIARMCGWAGVSESGFHAWARRTPSLSAQRRVFLAGEVKRVFDESNGVFGYRKVHVRLVEDGIEVCDRLVRALMAEQGLKSCHPKKWRHLTQPNGTPPAPDLIRRDFASNRPGVRLVGDITQIDTWEGPVFLATVIDLYNREVIGWAMAEHHRASLVCDAIIMARQNRRVRRRAVFHSDRGAEYTSGDFRRCLKLNGRLRSSMGQVGCAYDNAVAESFFASLKKELVHRTVFATRARAVDAVANYIEVFYNHRRPHQSLGYQTPAAARAAYTTDKTAA